MTGPRPDAGTDVTRRPCESDLCPGNPHEWVGQFGDPESASRTCRTFWCEGSAVRDGLREALEAIATERQEMDDWEHDEFDWRKLARKQENIARQVLGLPSYPGPGNDEERVPGTVPLPSDPGHRAASTDASAGERGPLSSSPEPGTVPFADQGADILAGHDTGVGFSPPVTERERECYRQGYNAGVTRMVDDERAGADPVSPPSTGKVAAPDAGPLESGSFGRVGSSPTTGEVPASAPDVPTDARADYEVTYDAEWKDIIEEGGVLNMDQLKRELHDYSVLMRQAGRVYDHITGGRLSKTTYTAEAVIAESDDYTSTLCDEAVKEAALGWAGGSAPTDLLKALDDLVVVLITVKPHLTEPLHGAPVWTPWTRWCERPLVQAGEVADKYRSPHQGCECHLHEDQVCDICQGASDAAPREDV